MKFSIALCLLLLGLADPLVAQERGPVAEDKLFARENLVAWCIVPFDAKKRGPEERAAMLGRLGFTRFAYDYRAEHISTFDAEMEALKKHGIELTAWWFPPVLNDESRGILDVLKRHKLRAQLWVTGGGEPTKSPEEQAARVKAEAARIRPIAEEAAKIGCSVALYNHGGWFGEPENQIALIEELKLPNVGIVYNQHHGHDHLERFPALLKKMLPHLVCLNLNGMMPDGERRGQKILPLGQGDLDLNLLRTIAQSGYRGPIGILGHTQDDAEQRLQDNLDGLDWLVKQLDGAVGNAVPGVPPKPKPRTPVPAANSPRQGRGPVLGPGKFGHALDARDGGMVAYFEDRYGWAPLTVECWTRLTDKRDYNILVAFEPKTSSRHWELFTVAGTGELAAYFPGGKPDHVRSKVNLVDGTWHHVAMQYDAGFVRLLVDGKEVARELVTVEAGRQVRGNLGIGRLPDGEIGCRGWLDDLHISRGIRSIDRAPDGPAKSDHRTIGLWRFDELHGGISPDASSVNNPARAPSAATEAAAKTPPDHWGRAVIGFDWKEADSVDNRWNQTQIGPFLASIVPLPKQQPVEKGLSIKVGDRQQGTVCYDTQSLSLRAGWTGGFLKFDPARYGLINSPKIAGELAFASPLSLAWGGREVRYRGLAVNGSRVVLSAKLGGTLIRLSPWLEEHDGLSVFTQTIQTDPDQAPLTYLVGRFAGRGERITVGGVPLLTITEGATVTAWATLGDAIEQKLIVTSDAADPQFGIPPGDRVRTVKVLCWSGTKDQLAKFAAAVKASPPPEDLAKLSESGPPRWTAEIVTQGKLSNDKESPYVVDTLTLPFDNPYKALMFASGHDFFANGDIALCTVHGDVWRVSGVDDDLDRLVWRRFATGLFQPLGLTILHDQVYVLGRDQITRLLDHNGDGEADEYQCFTNDYTTSAGGHDYVTCLEADEQGRLYFMHATQGLMEVAADGSSVSPVATGFRNPNGMGLGPGRVLTVSPQEGEWTPGSMIMEVRRGGYYGYGGPKAGHGAAGHDPPLAWLPRMMDNSSGGQVWVTSERWGPLTGQLLHLSYGKCRMMLVLRERVGEVVQGAVVEFPGATFSSGAMRGRFSPHDGQMYVSGLKGWASAAVDDGCLQRVRYTGRPVTMPIDRKTYANGLAITFSQPLDPATAEDPGSYHLEQWNYRYSAAYGSPDLKVSDPAAEGHDEVAVRSATLLEGGRTVFLEIDGFRPAQQTSIEYSVKTAGGQPLRQTLVATTHVVPERQMDEGQLRRREPPPQQLVEESFLAPGVLVRFSQGSATSVRTSRLAAWYVGKSAGGGLAPGAFDATATGFVKVPLRGDYAFHFTGRGSAKLRVNGKLLLDGAGDLAGVEAARTTLHQGYNRLEIEYSSPADGPSQFRLWWTDGTFAAEPVPPTALYHDSRDEALRVAEELRRGMWLAGERRCYACHPVPGQATPQKPTGPSLADAGSRLQPEWIYRWLLDPAAIRPQAHMPRMFDGDKPDDRQAAADLAAHLMTLQTPASGSAGASPSQAKPPPGALLFEDLGCVACHRLSPQAEHDPYDRLPLVHVAGKFRPGKLAEFLRHPQTHFPLTRMPDFALSEAEAAALAEHLTSGQRRETPAAAELANADAARGQALFRQHRCDACHTTIERGRATPVELIPLRDLTRGCLATEDADRGRAPHFGLSASESGNLAALYGRRELPSPPVTPGELLPHVMASLRCGACHNRDHHVAPLRRIIAEESEHGLVPDSLPNLTWTGEKLHGDWLTKLLEGKMPYRTRPWLKARMPAFGAYADLLAEGLANEHGLNFSYAPKRASKMPPLAAIGDRLTRKDGGLDCRSCHAVGRDQPTGDERTKVAQGINFVHTRERLRDEFYLRFVLDPPRHDVTTRMPKLTTDGRKTNATAILDGDARKQFEAIWQFIQTVGPR